MKSDRFVYINKDMTMCSQLSLLQVVTVNCTTEAASSGHCSTEAAHGLCEFACPCGYCKRSTVGTCMVTMTTSHVRQSPQHRSDECCTLTSSWCTPDSMYVRGWCFAHFLIKPRSGSGRFSPPFSFWCSFVILCVDKSVCI